MVRLPGLLCPRVFDSLLDLCSGEVVSIVVEQVLPAYALEHASRLWAGVVGN